MSDKDYKPTLVYGSPITITELLQLTHVGIPVENITWPRVSLSQDHKLCVRHGSANTSLCSGLSTAGKTLQIPPIISAGLRSRSRKFKSVSVVTIMYPRMTDSSPKNWQTSAEEVKVNPEGQLITMKAGRLFQVYDLNGGKKICKFRLEYHVDYWTWVDASTIAAISETDVYHCDITSKNVTPVRTFSRHPRTFQMEIVSYNGSTDGRWCALVGLYIDANRVCGLSQLYSSDYDLSQLIEAHSVAFCRYKFEGNVRESNVFVAASRQLMSNQGKLHVVELGPHSPENSALVCHTDSIQFVDDWQKYDFCVAIQISSQLGLVYALTKYGKIHLFDLETAAAIFCTTICTDVTFALALNTESQGVLVVARNGQVLAVDLKRDYMVRYVNEILKRSNLSDRLRNKMAAYFTTKHVKTVHDNIT